MNATTKSIHAESSAVMLAIDLAKDVFELAFADAAGRIVERKRLKRKPFAQCLHNRAPLRIVMRITKRGDVYLRTLLIHGARSALVAAHTARKRGQPLDRTQHWALALAERKGHNKAAVALANKTARRLWAAEHHGTSFDPEHVSRREAHAA